MIDDQILQENLHCVAGLPDGWRELYLQLIKDIHSIDAQIKVVDAKEKFGEMRVYMKTYNAHVYALIDEANARSRRLCQTCGASAFLSRTADGFYATVCPSHSEGFTPARLSPMRHVRVAIEASEKDWGNKS